jgi:hypothetical protein
MRKTLLATVLAAPLLAQASPTNLIVNGSFEDVSAAAGVQSLAAGTWQIFGSIPGWTGNPDGIEVRNNVAGTAFDGLQFVELDTNRNSAALQSIATVAGLSYDLSFYYSPRPGVTGATTNDIQVLWNGALLGQQGGAGGASHNWQQFQFSVLGTGNDSLEFRAVGTSDSLGGSLDMVSLTQAVPEPASLALVMAGFVAAGAARRRAPKA